MERLTEKVLGNIQLKACGNDFCKETCAEHDEEKSCDNCPIQKAFEKLAEYEDLEEQGKLLKLPCAVGDAVYRVSKHWVYIESCQITGFAECDSVKSMCYTVYIDPDEEDVIALLDFGKTVFLTRPEAEQALKEMEGKK